jgi:2-oxo-4-hydroxy-4-carboxy-5-ureidoimidazoline decarboxylase
MPYSLAELNQMSQTAFVDAVGAVCEHTPAIAAQAWMHRPFQTVADLHEAIVAIINQLSPEAQLALIRAHPDLGSKAKMADASVQEQASAGLSQLTPEEYQRLQDLNQTYTAKFGFPFIIAVRNQDKAAILAAFDRRLQHSVEQERQQALIEIGQIAKFRLMDWVTHSSHQKQ